MRFWRRALWVSYLLRLVPYVRLVGLNGSLVTGTAHSGSDIDFFIVLKKGRIFTGRFLVTTLVQMLGVRRHGPYVAGRICLNRYASTDFLVIGPPNQYHAQVFHNLIPLYATPEIYQEFLLKNSWMKSFAYPPHAHEIIWKFGGTALAFQRVGELVMDLCCFWLEPVLRNLQLDRLAGDERAHLPGSRVVISDQELCFHTLKDA